MGMAFLPLPSSKAMQHWVHEVREVFRRSWPVFSTVLLFNLGMQMYSNWMEPHFRTYVACPDLVGDPDGSASAADGGFSGSPLCGDRNYVVQSAARTSAVCAAIGSFSSVLSLPVLGAISDEKGRLPVLWFCIAGRVFGSLLVMGYNNRTPVLYLGAMITGLASAFFPTFHAILADHGGNRPLAFTIKIFTTQAGFVIGLSAASFVLRLEVLDYTLGFLFCVGIFLMGATVATRISESRPPPLAGAPATWKGDGGWAARHRAVLLPLKSRFFARYCVADFFNYVVWSAVHVLKSYTISALGWRQGRFEQFMVLNTFAAGITTFFVPAWIRRWSAEVVVRRCMALQVVACAALVFAPAHPAFFMLPILAVSASGCRVTASTTLIAERFKEHTGKAMATVHAVVHCGTGTGPLLFSRLYVAGATGVLQSAPFIAVLACAIVGHFALGHALATPMDPVPLEAGPVPHEARYTEVELSEQEEQPSADGKVDKHAETIGARAVYG